MEFRRRAMAMRAAWMLENVTGDYCHVEQVKNMWAVFRTDPSGKEMRA